MGGVRGEERRASEGEMNNSLVKEGKQIKGDEFKAVNSD